MRWSLARRIQLSKRRGRDAERIGEIPKAGWFDILRRTQKRLSQDYMSLVSAGVAFYALLAIFPGLTALISIYGLVADPALIQEQIDATMIVLPPEAAAILRQQLKSLASTPSTGLGFGVVGGILLALWSAAKGIKALLQGLNIAYSEPERRGFIKLNSIALLLTFGGMIFAILALALIAILPAVINVLQLEGIVATVISLLSWPLLLVAVMVALAVIYRYGPSRTQVKWHWLNLGVVVATTLWLAGSLLFSIYVANFGSYSKTYGSVGAIIILMLWFFLSAYAILLGAQLNAEIEHQTARDSTSGPEQPLGQRGAHMADSVGERQH